MLRYITYLEDQPKRKLIVFSVVQVLVLGVVDLGTGWELSLSIFYLLPIAIAAWFVGWQPGLAISLLAAVSWLAADVLSGHEYSHPTIPFWNSMVRLGFFVIVTYALSALRASRERKAELVNFIVHDLRSPLSIVMTGLQTLRELPGETLSPTQSDLIDLGMSSSTRMLILINSILDLARLEGDEMPLQPAEIEIAPIVQNSIDSLKLWADQKEITLSWSLVPGVHSIYADPTVTERVLVNLLSNAIKFSDKNSEVTIRVEPYPPDMAAFEVRDQGKGIPKEWVDRIFDKFTQVGTSGVKSGSGLGLSFCRLAVKAQGGRIWAESEVGRGTTITFTLPVKNTNLGD
jgi:signal transduction histidine kinase